MLLKCFFMRLQQKGITLILNTLYIFNKFLELLHFFTITWFFANL